MKRILLILLTILAWLGVSQAGPLPAVETEHYRIEYTDGQAGMAKRLAGEIEAWHTRIYAELGAEPSSPATIAVAANEAEMFALVAERQKGSHPPEWAAGLAYPRDRNIYVHAGVPAEELLTTVQHEISHLAMGAAAGAGRVPIWFSEGVAVRQSEPLALERMWLLTEAALMDRLLPLSALERGYPKGAARAGVGYAQSVHFVGYLIREHGAGRFRTLMQTLARGEDPFGEVVADVYGVPLAAIEAEWRQSLNFWWGWIPVVFAGTFGWVLLGLLAVYGWRRRRREQARRMHDMAGREAVDMAEDVEIAHDLRPPSRAHDPYEGRPPSIH